MDVKAQDKDKSGLVYYCLFFPLEYKLGGDRSFKEQDRAAPGICSATKHLHLTECRCAQMHNAHTTFAQGHHEVHITFFSEKEIPPPLRSCTQDLCFGLVTLLPASLAVSQKPQVITSPSTKHNHSY